MTDQQKQSLATLAGFCTGGFVAQSAAHLPPVQKGGLVMGVVVAVWGLVRWLLRARRAR